MKSLLTCCCLTVYVCNAQTVDDYITNPDDITFETIGSVSNSLHSPIDLDFHPTRTNELWVLNQGTRNSGGSTVIFYDAGLTTQTSELRKDGNAWHFMAEATAMAFGDNGDWATAQGILDANHDGSLFTGPTLWPGDLSIYAMVGDPPSGSVNGSHLDMLHQSPYGMGIAHEQDNVYWVFDGFNANIARYDFGTPHYPGGSDHDDGKMRRYTEIQVLRDENIPSHMILNKSKGELYIVDSGNDRIIRLDINSGSILGSMAPLYGEVFAEFNEMSNADFETVISTGLDGPCGIDYVQDRILVMDNGTKEIIIYNVLSDPPNEIGRIDISQNSSNPMGLKVGPDGLIWFVDKDDRTVTRINHPTVQPTGIDDVYNSEFAFSSFPNPTSEVLNLEIPEDAGNQWQLKLVNTMGQVSLVQVIDRNDLTIDVSNLSRGMYSLILTNEDKFATRKVTIQ